MGISAIWVIWSLARYGGRSIGSSIPDVHWIQRRVLFIDKSHMATKRKRPPVNVRFIFACGYKRNNQSLAKFFPRPFPLSGQRGKLKGTSEKPRGVPPIFLAPYFVKQKYVPPLSRISHFKTITNPWKVKLFAFRIHTCYRHYFDIVSGIWTNFK